MNPTTSQNICQVFILIGVIISGLATYGSFYYGKEVDKLEKQPKTDTIQRSINIDKSTTTNIGNQTINNFHPKEETPKVGTKKNLGKENQKEKNMKDEKDKTTEQKTTYNINAKNVATGNNSHAGDINIFNERPSEFIEEYQIKLTSDLNTLFSQMPLGKNTCISIMYEHNSNRAQKLAGDISDYLKTKGYKMGGSGMGTFGVREGVTIWKEKFNNNGCIDIIVKF